MKKCSSYGVVATLVAMYAVKIVVKVSVGGYVRSPAITGDGYHNIADIIEALALLLVIIIANVERPGYPFGLKKVESLFALGTGVGLTLMSFKIAGGALAGLLEPWPAADAATRSFLPLPVFEPLRVGRTFLPLVLGVTVGSAVISYFVGRWQIRHGRASGHEAMVADGEETLSDGRLEIAIAIGIGAEYLFRTPWIEYPLALAVSGLILKTAWEIGRRGLRSLLLKSIGAPVETGLTDLMMRLPGVLGVEKMRTFFSGPTAVVIVKIISRGQLAAQRDLKKAIETVTVPVFESHGIGESKFYIRFAMPAEDYHRIAVAVSGSGATAKVAPTFAAADWFYVVDVDDGMNVRVRAHPAKAGTEAAGFLAGKRVRHLRCLKPGPDDTRLAESCRATVQAAAHSSLRSLGLA